MSIPEQKMQEHMERGNAMYDEIQRLEKELAEAKKDQARYQWLRDKAVSTKEAAPLVFFADYKCKPTWQSVLHGSNLDLSIDAAIASIQEKSNG